MSGIPLIVKSQLIEYCSCYQDLLEEISSLSGYSRRAGLHRYSVSYLKGDSTYDLTERRAEILDQIRVIEKSAKEVDPRQWVAIAYGFAPDSIMERFYWRLWSNLGEVRYTYIFPPS